jgi:hypothetical protein
MAKYNINNQDDTETIESVLLDLFDDYTEKNGKYIADNIDIDLVDEISIEKTGNEELFLSISHKTLDKARSQDMIECVSEAMKLKNEILERLTGKTVEQRKRKMRKKSLPTDSDIISDDI